MSLVEAPEAFLYGRLTGQTAVSSQIGTRIFPLLAPSGTPMPLIIYQRTAVDRPQSLAGNVGNPVITLQLTTYGTSYTSVKNIARAVRLAVDNWTGTTASVTIQRTTLTSESDGVELPQDDQMLPYYSVQQSFEFRINEALISPPPTVPGAPTITVAGADAAIEWTTPSDGGSPLTGYKLYADGSPAETGQAFSNSSGDFYLPGVVIEVSAVNAVGEGPKSAAVTVT